MSSPTPKPMTRAAPGGKGVSAGATGDREVFRLNVPVVVFYVWLVFAAANVVDLALQASPRFALIVGLVVLTITGVAYACGLRPRVIADSSGLTVVNPLREFHLPWSVIRAVDVRDWVRFSCDAGPDGSGRPRVVESWALFATARVKRNYTKRAEDYTAQTPATKRLPDEARRLMSQPAVVIMAWRIEQRLAAEQAAARSSKQAKAKAALDAESAEVTARWAWFSIATIAVPAVALVVTLLV
jgi:hypothetical protein